VSLTAWDEEREQKYSLNLCDNKDFFSSTQNILLSSLEGPWFQNTVLVMLRLTSKSFRCNWH